MSKRARRFLRRTYRHVWNFNAEYGVSVLVIAGVVIFYFGWIGAVPGGLGLFLFSLGEYEWSEEWGKEYREKRLYERLSVRRRQIVQSV